MSAKVGPALHIVAVGATLAWALWDVVPNDEQPTGSADSAAATVTPGSPAPQSATTTYGIPAHPELDRIELELADQWSDPDLGALATVTCTTLHVTELLCDVSDPQLGGNGPTLVVTRRGWHLECPGSSPPSADPSNQRGLQTPDPCTKAGHADHLHQPLPLLAETPMRPDTAPARRARRAFTLLEMIVTIIVLGVLAVVTIPTYRSVIDRANNDQAERTSTAAVGRSAVALASWDNIAPTYDHLVTAVYGSDHIPDTGDDEISGVTIMSADIGHDDNGDPYVNDTEGVTLAIEDIDVCLRLPTTKNGAATSELGACT